MIMVIKIMVMYCAGVFLMSSYMAVMEEKMSRKKAMKAFVWPWSVMKKIILFFRICLIPFMMWVSLLIGKATEKVNNK